jgi:hypothetical protein
MPKRKGTRLGRPDLRPRLKPGQVRCGHCDGALLAAAAVTMNGQAFHPIGCFGPALAKWMAEVNERLDIVSREPGMFCGSFPSRAS